MIYDLILQLLNIIQDPIYCFSKENLQHIKKLANTVIVNYIDESNCEYNVKLFDNKNNYYGSVITYNIPQVIDIPPLFKNEHLQEIPPVLILNNKKDDKNSWKTVHELCHLFSIGPYIPVYKPENDKKNIFLVCHHFGINTYEYLPNKNALSLTQIKINTGINELINDFVTLHFMQILFNKEIKPPYKGLERFINYIKMHCANDIHQSEIVNWYFTGNTTKIKDFLLNKKYDNYIDLYNSLETF